MKPETDDPMPTDLSSEKPPVLDEPGYDVNEVEEYAIDKSPPPVLPEEEYAHPYESPPSRFGGLKSTIGRSCGVVDEFFERFAPEATPATGSVNESATGEWEDDLAPRTLSIWGRICSAADWMFGTVSLLVGLAILSVIPILNFASLGYLLQASANVAKSGRLRDGFVGVRKASRLGSFVLGTWLVLLPLRQVAGMWHAAELVAPGSANAKGWHTAAIILTIVTVMHLIWACLRGGKLRHFFWPAPIRFLKWVFHPDSYKSIRNSVLDYLISLRLPHYFSLGARGFAGAFVWLFIPVTIMILASNLPPVGAAFISFLASFPLMLAVMYLPFLQTRFACENRLAAMFEVGHVRRQFTRAPIAFWLALFITLLFAIPLYLLKIEATPQEVAWLPALVFMGFIFPARVLTGWAVSRANRREQPRFWLFRWMARLGAIPVVGLYALITYFTQFLSWKGTPALLEHHAFMVPAPLLGL
jgi:hypothetical protein